MKKSDLQFDYPESLVATTPQYPSRVLWVEDQEPQEILWTEFLDRIPAGDVLVVNNTQVLNRRIFAGDVEILFLSSNDQKNWQVLFPSRNMKVGQELELPAGRRMKLIEKGRPQRVEVDELLTEEYFQRWGELAASALYSASQVRATQSKSRSSLVPDRLGPSPREFCGPHGKPSF